MPAEDIVLQKPEVGVRLALSKKRQKRGFIAARASVFGIARSAVTSAFGGSNRLAVDDSNA